MTRRRHMPSEELVGVGATADPATAIAVYSRAAGAGWAAAPAPPATPATAVTFDAASQTWIAVGAGGTALSADGGRHWYRAKSGSTMQDSGWRSLSLPFAVGAGGKVGMLDRSALKP